MPDGSQKHLTYSFDSEKFHEWVIWAETFLHGDVELQDSIHGDSDGD
jgi:hypothetical protein